MCKAGGPRCPMDHKRRDEVNARRRIRDRATRAYRSGLVAALEDQGKDELAQVARKAPSGDLAVMAAATGNTVVGDGLEYVPGMRRANEKVSSDVVKALDDAGVNLGAENRGDVLAAVVADKADTVSENPVYANIDTPEKAQAAADAMYEELAYMGREEFESMDRDELEDMYNKYNAIDDAIRAQGNISADETSGNAFLDLYNVYHGLDEDGLPIDDEPDNDDETDSSEDVYSNIDTPEKAQAAADAMYAELENLDRDELEAMDRDELESMYLKYNAIDDAIRAQGNINADETSGSAFMDLHDVYHGLDDAGLPNDDEDVYVNIDSPEKAQAAADAMYAELESLSREDFEAMDSDELESMYRKYRAIDIEICKQGNIDADETSGNAIIDLYNVYNGLDDDGMPIDDAE